MIGEQVGPLVIRRQLGAGGMGVVYLAEHALLGTPRVVKLLLPEWTQHAAVVQRFINEARAAAAIQHRNIIQVHDCAQLPDGRWYIVMDYVQGSALGRLFHTASTTHVAVRVLAQIANGLDAAHRRGIIHRDLKPDNVMISEREGNTLHATILDFGVAHLGEDLGGGHTSAGTVIGTPGYMAPEQMRGLPVGPAADVYALGIIAFQMMSGGWLPFQEAGAPGTYENLSAEELYARQTKRPPPDVRIRNPAVPEAWARVIASALAAKPEARPASAQHFALQLAEVTPSDGYAPSGIEIVRTFARELLDIGDMLDTVRAPGGGKPGTQVTLASRYQLGAKLGTGGMADVFAGTSVGAEGFARPVAIKRVLPGFSELPEFAAMFVEEARLASRLDHPNIVSVLDFDRDAEGRLFLVMELIDGMDLSALAATGLLPLGVVVFTVGEVLRGLGYAHRAGVVHRDVSPHNALLSWDGAVKVSDFGIAKARDASTGGGRSEVLKGKPGYMSPEQANSETLDGRSDLFAVGVVLWEMLVGQRLFQGSMREVLAQVMFRAIAPPSTLRQGIAPDLEAVVMRLLERDLDRRFATAEDAIDALAACADAPRDGRGELVRTMTQRFPIEAGARARRIGSSGASPSSAAASIDEPVTRRAGVHGVATPPSFVATASAPLGVPAPYAAAIAVTSAPITGVAPAGSRIGLVVIGMVLGVLIAVGAVFAVSRGGGTPAAPPAVATIDAGRAASAPPLPSPVPGDAPAATIVDAAAPPPPVVDAAPPRRPIDAAPAHPAPPPPPAGSGMLAITVTPWAQVAIDGRGYGTTPVHAKLAAGRHRVTLDNPDAGKHDAVTIVVEPNREATLSRSW